MYLPVPALPPSLCTAKLGGSWHRFSCPVRVAWEQLESGCQNLKGSQPPPPLPLRREDRPRNSWFLWPVGHLSPRVGTLVCRPDAQQATRSVVWGGRSPFGRARENYQFVASLASGSYLGSKFPHRVQGWRGIPGCSVPTRFADSGPWDGRDPGAGRSAVTRWRNASPGCCGAGTGPGVDRERFLLTSSLKREDRKGQAPKAAQGPPLSQPRAYWMCLSVLPGDVCRRELSTLKWSGTG